MNALPGLIECRVAKKLGPRSWYITSYFGIKRKPFFPFFEKRGKKMSLRKNPQGQKAKSTEKLLYGFGGHFTKFIICLTLKKKCILRRRKRSINTIDVCS
jgi:hypothetical protein